MNIVTRAPHRAGILLCAVRLVLRRLDPGRRMAPVARLADQLVSAARSARRAGHAADDENDLRRIDLGTGHGRFDDPRGPVLLRLGVSVRSITSIRGLVGTPATQARRTRGAEPISRRAGSEILLARRASGRCRCRTDNAFVPSNRFAGSHPALSPVYKSRFAERSGRRHLGYASRADRSRWFSSPPCC